jgi:hypothetical protein
VNAWDLFSQIPRHELLDRATGDKTIEEEGGVEMAGGVDGLLAIFVVRADGGPIATYTPPGSKWNIELSAA